VRFAPGVSNFPNTTGPRPSIEKQMRLDPARFEHSLQTFGHFSGCSPCRWPRLVSPETRAVPHNPVFVFLPALAHGFHSGIGCGCLLRQRRKREKCNQQSDRKDFSRTLLLACALGPAIYRNSASSVSIPCQAAGLPSGNRCASAKRISLACPGSTGLLVRNPLTTVSQSTIHRRIRTF